MTKPSSLLSAQQTSNAGCMRPITMAEFGLRPQNIIDDLINYLEQINDFFVSTHFGQIFLLIVTMISLTSFTIMYVRFTSMRMDVKDLQQKLYDLQVEKYQAIGKLAKCEHIFDHGRRTEFKQNLDADIIYRHDYRSDYDYVSAEPIEYTAQSDNDVIQPSTLSDIVKAIDKMADIEKTETINDIKFETDDIIPSVRDHNGRTIWAGNNDIHFDDETPQTDEKEQFYINECDGDDSLYSIYTRKYCDDLKKRRANNDKNIQQNIYPTQVTHKTNIDVTIDFENADKNCENDETHKYNRPTATKDFKTANDDSKYRKNEKNLEKTKGKWEKIQTKYLNDNSSAERYNDNNDKKKDRHEKKERYHERKFKDDKENEKEKEYKKKSQDHKKDIKKFKDDKDYENGGKWTKLERKRDAIKVYDNRYGD